MLCVIEVQQVAVGDCATLEPYWPALHRVVGSRIHGLPGAGAVIGMGNIHMPDPAESRVLRVSCRSASQEREGSAIIITGRDLREGDVLHTETRPDIVGGRPGEAFIIGIGDGGVIVIVSKAEIDPVVYAYSDGW